MSRANNLWTGHARELALIFLEANLWISGYYRTACTHCPVLQISIWAEHLYFPDSNSILDFLRPLSRK